MEHWYANNVAEDTKTNDNQTRNCFLYGTIQSQTPAIVYRRNRSKLHVSYGFVRCYIKINAYYNLSPQSRISHYNSSFRGI